MNPSDATSLALAKEVARRLLADERVLFLAKDNLRRWRARNIASPSLLRCYAEWEPLLDLPKEQVAEILTAETERSQTLRTNNPFAGVLSPQEVWDIKQKVRQLATPEAVHAAS